MHGEGAKPIEDYQIIFIRAFSFVTCGPFFCVSVCAGRCEIPGGQDDGSASFGLDIRERQIGSIEESVVFADDDIEGACFYGQEQV